MRFGMDRSSYFSLSRSLSGSQCRLILWPYHLGRIGWFQRIESRSGKDQRVVHVEANDERARWQQSLQLLNGNLSGDRPSEGNRGRSELLGTGQRATTRGEKE
jgi:hypothetical protein